MTVARHNPDLDSIFDPEAEAPLVLARTALPFFDAALDALERARTIDEVKQIRDKAEALRAYAHQARSSLRAQNHCAEIKLRAERRLGEMLTVEVSHEGGRPPKQSLDATVLPPTLDEMGITKSQSSRWQSIAKIPTKAFEAYVSTVKGSGEDEITTAGLLRAANRLNTVAARTSSETWEWYTPVRYVNAARAVLSQIDLDPASCERANETVRAKRFFATEDDGLSRPWSGRIWLNPPYGLSPEGRSNQGLWSETLHDRFRAGEVEEAILLVNSATDASWFQLLWSYPICFVDHRIRFETADGRGEQPTHGSVFVYFGNRLWRFAEHFNPFGRIVVPLAELSAVLHTPR